MTPKDHVRSCPSFPAFAFPPIFWHREFDLAGAREMKYGGKKQDLTVSNSRKTTFPVDPAVNNISPVSKHAWKPHATCTPQGSQQTAVPCFPRSWTRPFRDLHGAPAPALPRGSGGEKRAVRGRARRPADESLLRPLRPRPEAVERQPSIPVVSGLQG